MNLFTEYVLPMCVKYDIPVHESEQFIEVGNEP